MKTRLLFNPGTWLVVLICLGMATAYSAPPEKKGPAGTLLLPSNAVPKSVFTVPTSLKQGHDPFFPNRLARGSMLSTRLAAQYADVTLVLNGLSGTPDHRLAMINGRTLAEGEQVEVPTPSGRVMVRCIEIKGERVVVEVGGERRELHFRE